MDIVITAMPSDIAAALVRDQTGRRVAVGPDGGGPCRHCLRPAAPGEDLLLLTYQPFRGDGPYAVPSPVFVHADGCERYADVASIPAFARDGLRAVRAYDDRHDLVDGEVVPGTDLDAALARLLADDRAAYAHVHSADAGCFTFRVDRR